MSEALQHLRRTALHQEGPGLTDGQLLGRFIEQREDGAFAALVRRHGPMVWGVCRRLLGHEHDAEDAFQATFLVLVRKAASVVPRERVANWLYGVAHQTSLQARRNSARRRAREKQMAQMPEPAVAEEDLWADLRPLLDQELSRLPDVYREAIVLSDLEGKTRKEVARQLGLPEGTVASRLARGRVMLAKRLARHGLAVSAGSLAAVLTQNAALASAPTSVVASTVKAASLFAAGPTAAPGLISVRVAALAEGVLKTMLLTKLKIATAMLVTLAVVAAGASLRSLPAPAAEPPKRDELTPKDGARPKPAKPVVVRQDAMLVKMAMSADGEVVATVGCTHDGLEFNSTVKLWDARTGKLKRALAEEKASFLGIAFSPNLLAIGVNSILLNDNAPRWGTREVRLLDAKTLKLKYKIDKTLVPDVYSWSALAFSPDGKRLAVAGNPDNNGFAPPFVKLWDIEKKKLIEGKADLGTVPGERNRVRCLAFSPDGKLVAASWLDGMIRLFDGRTGDFKALLLDPKLKPAEAYHGASGLAFSPDSKTLASNGGDNTVALWDLTEEKPPKAECPDENKIKQLIANLEADRFATREKAAKELEKLGKSAEGTMRKALAAGGISLEAKRRLEQLLNKAGKAKRLTLKGTLKGHKGPVETIAFSKDGRWIATGGRAAKEGTYEVILWDAKTGKVKQTFAGLTEWVRVVAFSPDGKALAVCGGHGHGSDGGKGRFKTSGELTLFRLE